jgi:integrase
MSMKTREALIKWLPKKRRTLTFASAEYLTTMVIRWDGAFGDTPLEDLRRADLKLYEESADDGTRGASALNRERGCLRQFFRWCQDHQLMGEDPTVGWRHRKEVVSRQYAPVSRCDERLLCDVACCSGFPWMAPFISFSIATGLRAGTVRQLTWADVEFDEDAKCGHGRWLPPISRRARHCDLRDRGDLKWAVVVPAKLMKTREALRIPLSHKAVYALGAPQASSKRLFPEMPDARKLYRQFKEVGKRAGINPASTPHDLRRTWVQRMQEGGASLQETMALGAWKSPGTLLNHYFSPVRDSVARELLEKV